MSPNRRGILFAAYASICNASIGIANDYGFVSASPYEISFFRCVGALIICALICFLSKIKLNLTIGRAFHAAILAFFGVFCLYFFETMAFSVAPIALVSFATYGSGILCVILGIVVLRESVTFIKCAALLLVMLGMVVINQAEYAYSLGLIYSLLGGVGYSMYLFLMKLFREKDGVSLLFFIFLFGSIFLFVPWYLNGAHVPAVQSMPSIIWLSVVPTFLGFYFANKALALSEAGTVQIVQTSEPLFASLLGFLMLQQTLSFGTLKGCAMIFIALILLSWSPKKMEVLS